MSYNHNHNHNHSGSAPLLRLLFRFTLFLLFSICVVHSDDKDNAINNNWRSLRTLLANAAAVGPQQQKQPPESPESPESPKSPKSPKSPRTVRAQNRKKNFDACKAKKTQTDSAPSTPLHQSVLIHEGAAAEMRWVMNCHNHIHNAMEIAVDIDARRRHSAAAKAATAAAQRACTQLCSERGCAHTQASRQRCVLDVQPASEETNPRTVLCDAWTDCYYCPNECTVNFDAFVSEEEEAVNAQNRARARARARTESERKAEESTSTSAKLNADGKARASRIARARNIGNLRVNVGPDPDPEGEGEGEGAGEGRRASLSQSQSQSQSPQVLARIRRQNSETCKKEKVTLERNAAGWQVNCQPAIQNAFEFVATGADAAAAAQTACNVRCGCTCTDELNKPECVSRSGGIQCELCVGGWDSCFYCPNECTLK